MILKNGLVCITNSPSCFVLLWTIQLYKSGRILQLQDIIQSTQCCISDMKDWMKNNKLRLNEDKTDMIPISARKVLNNAPLPSEICLNGPYIKLSQTVHNLGITLDQTLSFQQHYFKRLSYLLSWAPRNQHNPSLPLWKSHKNSNLCVGTI